MVCIHNNIYIKHLFMKMTMAMLVYDDENTTQPNAITLVICI
jgi:hypothetical protein